MPAPTDAHEWVSFEDPSEDRTWVFDVTFLSSPWRCIYGEGCQGVLSAAAPELAEGCCSYGAHFSGEEDAARVEQAAATLGPKTWQFARESTRRHGPVRRARSGALTTRLVKGACIFLNRPGFAGGAGCALHLDARRAGTSPIDAKPSVCWQLPVRVDWSDDGTGGEVATVRAWRRSDWGPEGETMAWCCTEGDLAHVGDRPVVESLGEELEVLVGTPVYVELRRRLGR